MLPSAKRYLLKGGLSEQTAGFMMMACFVGGFIGIQAVSRLLHRFMPSHVVDCDHTHDETHSYAHSDRLSGNVSAARAPSLHPTPALPVTTVSPVAGLNGEASESTPLLPAEVEANGHLESGPRQGSARSDGSATPPDHLAPHNEHVPFRLDDHKSLSRASTQLRRSSIVEVRNRVMSFVRDTKPNCDDSGPCYGYSDPCGLECLKHMAPKHSAPHRLPRFFRTVTAAAYSHLQHPIPASVPEDDEERQSSSCVSPTCRGSRAQSRERAFHDQHDHEEMQFGDEGSVCAASLMSADKEAHHHHVPTNAFMAISLQTVIAIALHKFPEGFITYATNHANPSLGFNVFMALFVHNIAEGFAMALPLYMAIGSRVKAIAWASLLGGLSQPLGAAVAVIWFKLASDNHFEVDNVAYACLFAVTAGIMTSVALQLFVESLSLNHNSNLSMFFGFLGMTMMGLSSALVND